LSHRNVLDIFKEELFLQKYELLFSPIMIFPKKEHGGQNYCSGKIIFFFNKLIEIKGCEALFFGSMSDAPTFT
jgi:hypothetical protein